MYPSAFITMGIKFGAKRTKFDHPSPHFSYLWHSVPNVTREANVAWLTYSWRSVPNPLPKLTH